MRQYDEQAVQAAAQRAYDAGSISIERMYMDTGLDRKTVRNIVRGLGRPPRQATVQVVGQYLEDKGVAV